MFASLHTLGPYSVALLLTAISTAAVAQVPGEYRVTQGRVDPGTYAGWRLYHTACFGCHGVDGLGTDLAPNLVERVQRLTPRAFVTKVLTSYRIVLPDDEEKSPNAVEAREAQVDRIMRRQRDPRAKILMPAWEGDAKVNPHVLDLFAYLSARADGKLGPGKPLLIKDQKQRSRHAIP
jgi:mono/diheme cytochrome c family protein